MDGSTVKRSRSRPHRTLAALAALMMVAAACSEKTDPETSRDLAQDSEFECDTDSIVECAPDGTTLDDLIPDAPIVADGEPIKIGMINNESGPAAAFPELTLGTEAGVRWLNEEMGGVDGHPIDLITCDVKFSATGAQSCGQRMVEEDVLAVLGGIDLFGDGIQVLEDNGIPYIGGVPVSFTAVESPTSFQFSGGSWGQNLGFVYHMVEELDVERVSIMYGDFGSVVDGAEWARRSLIGQGIAPENINMVPMPIVTEDVLTPLTAANQSDPDAIIVLVADAGCGAAYQAMLEVEITAQTYWSGGCLEPTFVDAVGGENLEGYIYGIENPLEGPPPSVDLYDEVIKRYGSEGVEAGSAATIAFGSLMNLYVELVAIGADDLSSQAIIDDFRSAVDRPSYMGHAYTCDGQQMGGDLPAICAPQQILTQMTDGELEQISDWIDVSALVVPEE